MWLGNQKVPKVLQSLMPVVIIPLGTSLAVGLVMFLLLGRPLAAILNGLQNWLTSMSGSSALLLGVILGLMMCFDLGGPVNKAAYLFATAGLSTGDEASLKIMAAVILNIFLLILQMLGRCAGVKELIVKESIIRLRTQKYPFWIQIGRAHV